MKGKRGKYAVKIGVLTVLFMMPLFLTGCWNNKDLTEINMVTALGIDRLEDGKVVVTVQVVEPAAIQSTTSGKGKGGGAQAKPVFVESYEGETVFDALRSMLSIVDKKMFLGTIQIIILGEGLSRNGINEIMDFFQRDHEIEYDSVDVLVAKGTTPKELLELENDMDPIPAVYIKKTVENTSSRAKVKKTTLIELFKDMGNSGVQISLGQVEKSDGKDVRTEGTAVFRDGKLIGWLDSYETRGYLFAENKVKSTIVNLRPDDVKISMEIIRSDGKVSLEFKNGNPVTLAVKVELEANIGEYEGKGKLKSPDDLHKLETLLSQEVAKEIRSALDKAQKDYSSDIFGFGIQAHKYHSGYWKREKENWNYIFSKLPVDVQVKARVKSTGLIKYPVNKDE